jgi:Amino acid permease
MVMVPLVIVGVVPILNGHVDYSNFAHLVPPVANGAAESGNWNLSGWTLALGGMFLAAWSTYAFETAVCYTSEFRNPGIDTFKAIFGVTVRPAWARATARSDPIESHRSSSPITRRIPLRCCDISSSFAACTTHQVPA